MGFIHYHAQAFAKGYPYIPMSLQVCAICQLGKQHRSHVPKENMNKKSKINELIIYIVFHLKVFSNSLQL
jgi:hypothetical protein